MRNHRFGVIFVVFLATFIANVQAGLFDDVFKNLFGNVKGMIKNTVTEMTNSILSGVGGLPNGASRGNFAFASIIDNAFSRKNGIFVGDSSVDSDWKVDGNEAIGAILKRGGGGVGVSVNSNGFVSFTQGKGKSKPTPQPSPTSSPKPLKSGEPIPTPSSSPGPAAVVAIDQLMANWDEFMHSPIWDAQDNTDDGDKLAGASSRIVNGLFFAESLASGSQFMVKFFYDDEKNFYCSGALIGYPYVLTAAHCGIVVGDNVRVGGKLIRSGYKAKVASVHVHPGFVRSSLKDDIAVVKLEGLEDKKVLNENGVIAAKLNKRKKFPKEGSMLVVSGHGSQHESGHGYSEELLSTRQTVHLDVKCAEEITQGEIKNDHAHICAGDGKRSTTCVGDSGAGLWRYVTKRKNGRITEQYFQIVGVVSFGEVTDESMCPRGPPAVYQEVSQQYDWIVKVVGEKNLA